MTENPGLFFDPFLGWPVTALILVITVLVVFGVEWRKVTRHKSLRFISAAVFIIGLSGLLLRPMNLQEHTSISILLNGEYTPANVDSILQEYPKAKLLHTKATLPYQESTELASENLLASQTPPIRYVIGSALTPAGLDVLNPDSFTYLPGGAPTGITSLLLPQHVTVNSVADISGVYQATDSSTLILAGPGGKEDSVTFTKPGRHPFTLSFVPRQAGVFEYSLVVNGNAEPLPVNVSAERALRILTLQQFPTFETGYLKSLLALNHHLVVRYQLSREKYRFEYLNHPPVNARKITAELLAGFDLIIMDTDGMGTLSSNEMKTLDEHIRQGLGVLLLFNENPDRKLYESFLGIDFRQKDSDTVNFQFHHKTVNLPAWPINPEANDLNGIIRNKTGVLAGYTNHGFGKKGIQLLQETYKLTLQGDSSLYENIWSTLAHQVARRKISAVSVGAFPFPLSEGQPFEIEIMSNDHLPRLKQAGHVIPVAEDSRIDGIWSAKIWAGAPGWNSLSISDSLHFNYYVSQPGSWKSLAESQSRSRMASASLNEHRAFGSAKEPAPVLVSLFLVLAILGLMGLWLAPKL